MNRKSLDIIFGNVFVICSVENFDLWCSYRRFYTGATGSKLPDTVYRDEEFAIRMIKGLVILQVINVQFAVNPET